MLFVAKCGCVISVRHSTFEIADYRFVLHHIRTVDTKRFRRLLVRIDASSTDQVVDALFSYIKSNHPLAS